MLDDPVVLLGRLDHLAAFEEIVAAWLLNVDILPRLTGPDRGKRVPVVWRGDADDVDVLAVEDFSEVGLGLDLDPVLLFQFLGALVEHDPVGIAEDGDLHPRRPHEPADVSDPSTIDPEHRGPNCLVRPIGAGASGEPPSGDGAGGRHAERPTVHLGHASPFSSGLVRPGLRRLVEIRETSPQCSAAAWPTQSRTRRPPGDSMRFRRAWKSRGRGTVVRLVIADSTPDRGHWRSVRCNLPSQRGTNRDGRNCI